MRTFCAFPSLLSFMSYCKELRGENSQCDATVNCNNYFAVAVVFFPLRDFAWLHIY